MGRFSRLLQAKGKDIMIGDEKFTIKPLTGKYLGLFMEVDDSKKEDATYNLILVSLQQTDETLTIDDVKELPLNYITDIMKTITEVNELE